MAVDAKQARSKQFHHEKAEKSHGREGSPWTGLGAVITKEMADHLTSARMRILEIFFNDTATTEIYTAAQSLKNSVGQDRFLFLKLFTTARDPLPNFASFLVFLVPLISIALAFDAINGEFNRRTLSRVLAQPIYRDALLLGKFLAGLFTLTLVFTAIWLLIYGMGIITLGLPPSTEEVGRSLWFLVSTVFYGGIWLALAMTFSILFRQSATAALASIAVWLLFTIFWQMLTGIVAPLLRPIHFGLPQELIAQAQLQLALTRISPNTLYGEVMVALLQPTVRSLGFILPSQVQGAIPGTPLSLGQSLLLTWPQLTGLIAITILLFALGYVIFQRQEIRA